MIRLRIPFCRSHRSSKPAERLELRIGLIGPSSYPQCGTSIPFNLLLECLDKQPVSVFVVPVPRAITNRMHRIWKALVLIFRIVSLTWRVDVISAHLPTPQLANIGLVTLVIAKLSGCTFVIRKFGGMDLTELRPYARCLAEQVAKKSDVLFIESRKQCGDIGTRLGIQAFWFPNHRDTRMQEPRRGRRSSLRFAYVGRVQHEKGIGEILEAATTLKGRCSVDVYGPCDQGFDQNVFDSSSYVHYRGVVEHSEVLSLLSEYDALLLPTYWEGEGYPGVIIEAFQAGLPVIATEWKFIPEIVDATCGILVEPRDAEDLALAMDRLVSDKELFRRLQVGALSKSREFSIDRWGDLFVQTCRIAYETMGDKAETQKQIRVLYANLQ